MNSFESSMILKTAETMYLVLDNEGFCTGYFRPKGKMSFVTESSVIGSHFTEILPNSVNGEIHQALQDLDDEESIRFFEFSVDEDIWITMQVIFLDSYDSYLVTLRNSTEEKTALEMLQNNERRLHVIASSVKHDIKNYIFKVKGYLSILIEEKDFSYAGKIGRIIDEMQTIMQYLTDIILTSEQHDKLTIIDLSLLISQIARANIPKGIIFIQEKLPTIRGHRVSVLQIFRNLIENAVEHANPSKIVISAERDDYEIRIKIQNDGKPIRADIREEILQRLSRDEPEDTTQGLSVVMSLIRRHGWSLSLTDSPQTTFQVSIPLTT